MDAWKPRQMIWRLKNFDRVKINDKYKVVCKACKDDGWGKYIFSAVTTNMVKHLEKQHHELFVKMKAMEAEDKIQKKCQNQEKLQLQPDNSILELGRYSSISDISPRHLAFEKKKFHPRQLIMSYPFMRKKKILSKTFLSCPTHFQKW